MTRVVGPAGAAASWSAVALLGGLQALAFADRFLLALLATPISRAFGVDDLRMGALQGTAFILPFVVATLAFGWLADRTGRRTPILVGLVLWTLATAWSGLARSFGELLWARMLLGVGEAAVAPAALAQIALLAPARAGLATAVFAAGGPLGKGLALVGGGALLAFCTGREGFAAPWREVLLASALVNVFVAAAAWRLLDPPTTPPPAAGAAQTPSTAEGADGARLPAVIAGGVALVLASQVAALWTPSVLVRSFSLSAAQAGVATGAPLLLAVPASGLLTGWLLDRAAGRRPDAVVLPGLVAALLAVAPLALAIRFAPTAFWAEAAFTALVGCLGAGATASLRGVQMFTRERARGRIAGGYVATANLVGFGLGPPLVGWISVRAGGTAEALSGALATVLVGASLTGLLAIVALRGVRGGWAAATRRVSASLTREEG